MKKYKLTCSILLEFNTLISDRELEEDKVQKLVRTTLENRLSPRITVVDIHDIFLQENENGSGKSNPG